MDINLGLCISFDTLTQEENKYWDLYKHKEIKVHNKYIPENDSVEEKMVIARLGTWVRSASEVSVLSHVLSCVL